jgi:hypothetical protein
VWNGREDFRIALRGERIVLRGKRDTVKHLPEVLSITTLGEMAESAAQFRVRSDRGPGFPLDRKTAR